MARTVSDPETSVLQSSVFCISEYERNADKHSHSSWGESDTSFLDLVILDRFMAQFHRHRLRLSQEGLSLSSSGHLSSFYKHALEKN